MILYILVYTESVLVGEVGVLQKTVKTANIYHHDEDFTF